MGVSRRIIVPRAGVPEIGWAPPRKSSKTSSGLGGKIFRQFAAADFSALVSWERVEQEDPLRHLPAAQPRATKFQQHRFVGPFRGDDAGNDLLVAHRGRPAEDHDLSHTLVA